MTSRRDWQLAFLRQARSDWEAYQRTIEKSWPICHRLHFLQMASEKLGKALLIRSETKLERITQSHAAFVKFMRMTGNNFDLHLKLGITRPQLKAQFNQLLPVAYEIEILAPALAHNGPNPEYPWLDKTGQIVAPVDCSFPLAQALASPPGAQLLKNVNYFLAAFEKLFL